MMGMNKFSERIRGLRMEKGLSQTQLAAVLDRGDSAIRMWELGKSKPDMDTSIKLSSVFGVTLDYIFGLSDDKFPAPEQFDYLALQRRFDEYKYNVIKRANSLINAVSDFVLEVGK